MAFTVLLGATLAEYGRQMAVVALLIIGVFASSNVFPRLVTRYQLGKFPLVGEELGVTSKRREAWMENSMRLYQKGYQKFKDRAYRVTWGENNEFVVIPYTALDELRHLPNSHLNLNKEIHERTESKHTGMNRVNKDFLFHMVRSDLTRNLGRIHPKLAAVSTRMIDQELGAGVGDEWTGVTLYARMLKIVAIVGGEIFVGPDIAHSDQYYATLTAAVQDFFGAVAAVKRWPEPLKPVVKYISPEVKKLQSVLGQMRAMILPTIKERKEALSRGEEIPDDMITWMILKAPEWNQPDDVLPEVQFELIAVTIFTTTSMIVAALHELAIRPEVAEELRDEVKRVMEENNGQLTQHALYEMKLTDSFLRETARMNPQAPARFQRYVEKPVVLKDGTYIPAGSYIEAPAEPVLMDPSVFPEPEKFDARRFLNLREGKGYDPIGYENKERYQFVTATKEHLAFGWGTHTCPGRFWAANAIKLMLARILMRYDIRMPGGSKEKPPAVSRGLHYKPDPSAIIELRTRAVF